MVGCGTRDKKRGARAASPYSGGRDLPTKVLILVFSLLFLSIAQATGAWEAAIRRGDRPFRLGWEDAIAGIPLALESLGLLVGRVAQTGSIGFGWVGLSAIVLCFLVFVLQPMLLAHHAGLRPRFWILNSLGGVALILMLFPEEL